MNIDAAVCVCLDKREESWRDLIKQGKTVGLDIHPFICGDGSKKHLRYSIIDEVNPDVSRWGYGITEFKHHHYNAFRCHQKIIRLAKTAGFKNILILEDDAYITSRFTEVLSKLDSYGSIPYYDILYLGWWIGNEGDPFNNTLERLWNTSRLCGIDKAKQIGGLHGALISESMYDEILNMKPINPIDCQLNNLHNNIESYYIFPKIIHTKTMYSHCEGCVIERMIV